MNVFYGFLTYWVMGIAFAGHFFIKVEESRSRGEVVPGMDQAEKTAPRGVLFLLMSLFWLPIIGVIIFSYKDE